MAKIKTYTAYFRGKLMYISLFWWIYIKQGWPHGRHPKIVFSIKSLASKSGCDREGSLTTGLIRDPQSWPECQQIHVGTNVHVCMHWKVLVGWPVSWPWRRGHINNNCGKVLHDDLACPNMASATWLHTWIIKYYRSHGAIRTHQSRAI
jgi:hypothetical protein